MSKSILLADKSKEIALLTITQIASIVKQTLGPGGNPIIIQRPGSNPDGSPRSPLITKDGVTVAEAIVLKDNAMNTVAQAILQVAQNTVNSAGDGTTTAVVLAEALYKAGYKYLQHGGNGIQLYEELKALKNQVIEFVDSIKTPINAKNLSDVARISANGDEEIARVVVDALNAAGEDGYISIEEGWQKETTLQKVDGSVYKSGWKRFGPFGALLVSDKARNLCELRSPAVLLYAGTLDSLQDLTDLLYRIMGKDSSGAFKEIVPFLIVAHDFSEEVQNWIVQVRTQAKVPIAAIKSPVDGSPNARTEMLEDLAAILGGRVSARGILDLKDVKDEHLGSAEKVEILSDETVFYQGNGDPEEIMARIDDLKRLKASKMSDFDRGNINLRIGKLSGGIAVVQVGGDSELEMLEKKDRIEDAICAAKVAISDGIVPGGGYTLHTFAKSLPDQGTIGQRIMKEALQAPIKQIIINVGEIPEVVLSHMPEGQNQGYDARNKKYVDLVASGIVDPAKVTKSALENAVSIAGLLLTTGGAIVLENSKLSDGQPNPYAALMGGM